MTGDIGMHPDHNTEQRTPSTHRHTAWVAPLSCVTETDIRATGPSWNPGSDANGADCHS